MDTANKQSAENEKDGAKSSNTEKGKKEQVDTSNRSHREGHDNEDQEDLDSLKGKIPNRGE